MASFHSLFLHFHPGPVWSSPDRARSIRVFSLDNFIVRDTDDQGMHRFNRPSSYGIGTTIMSDLLFSWRLVKWMSPMCMVMVLFVCPMPHWSLAAMVLDHALISCTILRVSSLLQQAPCMLQIPSTIECKCLSRVWELSSHAWNNVYSFRWHCGCECDRWKWTRIGCESTEQPHACYIHAINGQLNCHR